jgi:hypothetical protein
MKNRTNKTKASKSWIKGVRDSLKQSPPTGWSIIDGINGPGVQLLPIDCTYQKHNKSGKTLDLTGSYKIVFELFRLNTSGNIKISARVASIEGEPLFHELNGIARALGCPKPKGTKKLTSQSVAAWPSDPQRKSFSTDDHEGISNWVREFLCKSPADFVLFVAMARNLLMK